jgi:hypothetical protein
VCEVAVGAPSFLSNLLLEVHESLALPTAVAKRETLTGIGRMPRVHRDWGFGGRSDRVCDGYTQGIDRV